MNVVGSMSLIILHYLPYNITLVGRRVDNLWQFAYFMVTFRDFGWRILFGEPSLGDGRP